ncbi:TPA: hypothetical protein ACK3JW_001222 [Mannheimia haemolytica]
MFSIRSKIEAAYLNPSSSLFQLIWFSRKHQRLLIFSIITIFIILPIIFLTKIHLDINHILKNIEQESINLNQQTQKYNAISNKIKVQNSKENNLTQINSTIQTLSQKHQIHIENLQWNLEQGKSIELSIISNSQSVFDFINAINQIAYLKYNMITLIKSKQDRKVEMNTTLVVLTNKE